MASDSNIKKGKALQGQSREIVYNVYKYFLNEAELFKTSRESNYFKKVQDRVAEATGVSRRSLNRILNEIAKEDGISPKFVTPRRGKRKKVDKTPDPHLEII